MNSSEINQVIEIQFPVDMLWTDADPDDYLADDTETAYAEAVSQALYKAGYDATVVWSNVATTAIVDEDGEDITDSRYSEIRGIIDSVDVDYIEDED